MLEQLVVGGRLVIPLGDEKNLQKLVRITRVSQSDYRREELCDVRFVPLIGERGWQDVNASIQRQPTRLPRHGRVKRVAELIREAAEPLTEIKPGAVGPLVERIGDSRLVLIGEATHGTSEFYGIRAEIYLASFSIILASITRAIHFPYAT